MHKYNEELRQLSDVLQAGLDMAKQLQPLELQAVKLRLTTSLRREQMFIHSLLGYAKATGEQERAPLKPLTHILGEEIIFLKPVTPADTRPGETETEKFLAEAEDYYANFSRISDEKVFHRATQPGGELLIRAVAKKAGYADFERADIDMEYIEAVRKCVEQAAGKDSAKEPKPAPGEQPAKSKPPAASKKTSRHKRWRFTES